LKGEKWPLLGPTTVSIMKVLVWTAAVGRCQEECVTPRVISGFHCGINGIFAA